MTGFHDYYMEYLGADEEFLAHGQKVFPSIHRVEPESSLSYMYHHLIVSRYRGELIHSVAPSLLPDYRETVPADTGEELLREVDDVFSSIYRGKFYRIREMLRYTTEKLFPVDPDIRSLTENDKDLALGRMSKRGRRVREKFWQTTLLPMVRAGRVISLVRQGKEISRSNVTDLPCGAANIDIWTHPDHRRKGYGLAVVKQAVNWCLLNGRIPVYLVHRENTPSTNLAENAGLELVSSEIQTVVIRY